jgi:ring-1,2-phenylacetyl-CoA epoxidase subunit PaaD
MNDANAKAASNDLLNRARALLEAISDPELPMLSIVDLGILRDILPHQGGVEVLMLPTYPGCPALDMIALEINNALTAAGIFPVKITMVTHPVWSTDMMSPDALHKLAAAGIAPPDRNQPVVCPKCLSPAVEEVNPFGATACRAIWRCTACGAGFDRFKCH